MSTEDKIILEEFRKALIRNTNEDVVDLDDSLRNKFDFKVYRFEELFSDTYRVFPPNRWSFYRMYLVTAGAGEFITGMHTFTATKNTLVIVPPRVITSSKNWSLDVEGYVLLFNLDFFLQSNFPRQHIENKKILSGAIQPYIEVSDKYVEDITTIFETIITENRENNAEKTVLIALKILELLIKTERLFDEQLHFETNVPVIDIIKTFNSLLEANFIQERSVTYYAEQLNLHPNYLNALIKKHTGSTAKDAIQNRLLHEIKYLLHSTSLSIKAISNQLGFNDPNYLSSFFARLEHSSPTKYRSSFFEN